MAKMTLTKQAFELLSNTLPNDEILLIRDGKISRIRFDKKPSYRHVTVPVLAYDFLDESIIPVPDRNYSPHGGGKKSFARFGVEDKAIREADSLFHLTELPPFPDIEGNE
jgi:hypothetical protein